MDRPDPSSEVRDAIITPQFERLFSYLRQGRFLPNQIIAINRTPIEFSNFLITRCLSRRLTRTEISNSCKAALKRKDSESITDLLHAQALARPPRLADRVINIILRYPDFSINNPEGLMGLPFGLNNEFTVSDEEIIVITRALKQE